MGTVVREEGVHTKPLLKARPGATLSHVLGSHWLIRAREDLVEPRRQRQMG